MLFRPDKGYVFKRAIKKSLYFTEIGGPLVPIICDMAGGFREQIILSNINKQMTFASTFFKSTNISQANSDDARDELKRDWDVFFSLIAPGFRHLAGSCPPEDVKFGHADIHRDNILEKDGKLFFIDWEIVGFRNPAYLKFSFFIHDIRIKFEVKHAKKCLRGLGRRRFIESMALYYLARNKSEKYRTENDDLQEQISFITGIYNELF